MAETIAVLYFWLKSAHLIFVIFWMAGLFILELIRPWRIRNRS